METASLTFREDGSVSFLQKKEGEPVQIYEGVFSFEKGGNVALLTEKAGDGTYPHRMNWKWHVDRDNMLWMTFENERQIVFMPTQREVAGFMEGEYALSYVGSWYDMIGTYTDQYKTEYEGRLLEK